MMERAHNVFFSWSKGTEQFDQENWYKKLGEGSGEDSIFSDPALGMEIVDDSPQRSTTEVCDPVIRKECVPWSLQGNRR